MKINSRRFASQAVSLARRSPEARAESAAERRHGRACSDTAGRAERASMPTAGSLDLPSFGATVLTTPGWSRAARRQQRCARTTGRGTTRALRRPGCAGREHRSRQRPERGIDRPRPPVPHRPAACSSERRWRGEQAAPARRRRQRRWGGTGSLRSRGACGRGGAVAGGGRLRARERPAGSGGAGVHAR